MTEDPWQDLAASLSNLIEAYGAVHASALENGFAPAPGSPAALERHLEPLAGAWGATPSADATTNSLLGVAGAMDHLQALATLLAGPVTMYAPYTVTRSAIEIAAQTWYLLDPDIDGDARALRHMNARLRSQWEVAHLPGSDERADAQEIRSRASQRIDTIVETAKSLGIPTDRPKNDRRPPTVGARPKSTTVLADECISDVAPGLGALYWRYCSAMAHGQMHGLTSAFIVADEPTPGGKSRGSGVYGQLGRSARDLAIQTAGAPLACISMLERLCAHMGWDGTGIQRDKFTLLLTWRRVGGVPILHASGAIPVQRPPESVPATFRP